MTEFVYSMEDPAKGESLFHTIVSSLDINTAYVDANFSDAKMILKSIMRRLQKQNKYGYSITLPSHGMETRRILKKIQSHTKWITVDSILM